VQEKFMVHVAHFEPVFFKIKAVGTYAPLFFGLPINMTDKFIK